MNGEIALLDAVLGEPPYDPRCERVETAVKAIWLLYRRAKWDLLAQVGLPRAEFEPIFATFDLTISRHFLNDEDTVELVRYAKRLRWGSALRLISACFWMAGQYRARKLTGQGVVIR